MFVYTLYVAIILIFNKPRYWPTSYKFISLSLNNLSKCSLTTACSIILSIDISSNHHSCKYSYLASVNGQNKSLVQITKTKSLALMLLEFIKNRNDLEQQKNVTNTVIIHAFLSEIIERERQMGCSTKGCKMQFMSLSFWFVYTIYCINT